jgi:integrase
MASIRQRGENSWQIIVSCGYDINGKKLIETKTVTRSHGFTDKQWDKELKRIALEFENQVKSGQYLDGSKISFADFVEVWIKNYASTELERKTYQRYRELLDRIIPALGHIRLDKLQPAHLLKFYANLKEKGIRIDSTYIAKPELTRILKEKGITDKLLAEKAQKNIRTIKQALNGKSIKHTTAHAISQSLGIKIDQIFTVNGEPEPLSDQTVKHHHRLISAILSDAVNWQAIKENPASRIKPPKVEPKEAPHYDEDTIELVLRLLDKEPIKYRTMMYLTIFTGVRLGELTGIDWSDLDLEKKCLAIYKASQYLPGIGTFTKNPKNESSVRIMALPDIVIDVVKEYKKWWNAEKLKVGDLWYKDDEGRECNRMFVQWNGKPIHPTTPTKWWKKFRVKNNLPELTFHGLRHTNASLLISQGVDVQTVAKRLGHSKATTTTSIYSHFLRRPDNEAAEKLQNLFCKQKSDDKAIQKG